MRKAASGRNRGDTHNGVRVSGFGVRAASEDVACHCITGAIVSRSKSRREIEITPCAAFVFSKSAARVLTANAIRLPHV
jgi:hypothetical protein